MVTGIICEYNPFHNGHKKQLEAIRAADPDGIIVCLMSGNFVQRGAPAIIDKQLRAKAAVACGADLVLELPVTAALSSAEGFAAEGVRILSGFCDRLCFGAETADSQALLHTAQVLLSEDFSVLLKDKLSQGLSFPAARQAALEALDCEGDLVASPNNILAVEYCKAILSQGSPMQPMVIHREGGYHSLTPDTENPSATFLRSRMSAGATWEEFVPSSAKDCFTDAPLHSLAAGERAILYRLRTMTDQEFESLPYGSEGLWRKLMHAARQYATLEEILEATKSKRYTRSRLDRMVMCATLGITREMITTPAPFVRVLSLGQGGRGVLKLARTAGEFINVGEYIDCEYQRLEDRSRDIYGLFTVNTPENAGLERKYRISCPE